MPAALAACTATMGLPSGRRLGCALATALVFAAVPTPAGAAQTNTETAAPAAIAPPFPELLRQTGGRAPALAASQAEVDVALGRAEQAAARPNPTVSLEVENFLGTGPYTGLNAAETTLRAELPLELGGRRSARIEAARAEIVAARARASRSRADFIRELAIAYAEAEAGQLRERLDSENLELARSDARTARILVENGREARLRQVQAEAAVQAAAAELEDARADRLSAVARLSALAGVPVPYSGVVGGLLDAPDLLGSPGALGETNILAARAERDAAAARVRSERAQRTPEVSVGLGVRRIEEENALAAVAGVSATVPLFNRNRGNIAAAEAELRAADARLQLATLAAQADFRSATAQVEAARSRIAAASAGEAAAAEAYRLARIGYDSGRLPLSDVLATRRALTEAREQLLEARTARVRAQVDLARAHDLIAGDAK
jgi:cobalt-zinc-cadmium efflux system outer membrane protein